ncbi:MAG: alginate lyase family protein [Sphingobacterium sp.]|nr:alginate lyase family protein [Sphingobacterium sp.]
MKIKIYMTLLSLLVMTMGASAQWLWNIKRMTLIRDSLHTSGYQPAYLRLLEQAGEVMGHDRYSVIQKEAIAPSGDKHDYVSLSRYWWPNPTTADHLPYVNRDGQSNPELRKYDRDVLGSMCADVNTLCLAFFYSKDEKYAERAVELIRTWFLNAETRMNPNLNYAQFIPGRDDSKGRPEGLIDSYSFVEMLSSLQLLKDSPRYTADDELRLKQWFSDFAGWMRQSRQGNQERTAKNNHATAYDAQLITYLLFSGDEPAARKIIADFPQKRIFAQIEPDGKQPNELWRTLSYHYSQYNLTHMLDVCATTQKLDINLLGKQSADGRSILKGIDYLTGFLGQSVKSWPYKQISGWDAKQRDVCRDLIRVLVLDPSQKGYRSLYKRYAHEDKTERWRLLYGVEELMQHEH